MRNSIATLLLTLCLTIVGCTEIYEKPPAVETLTSVNVNEADVEVQERIREYQNRVQMNPESADRVGELGIVFELHGFSSEALVAYELASMLDPSEFKWLYYRSILLAARFDLDAAIEEITVAIQLNPEYGPAHLQKGKFLLDHGQFNAALDTFEHAGSISTDPYVFVGQALAHLELNDSKFAIQALDQIEGSNHNPNVTRIRATALMHDGQIQTAQELLAELPNAAAIRWIDPIAKEKENHLVNHFMSRLNQAVNLIRAQSYESAKFVLLDLLTDFPTNKHVLHLLATVYKALGNDTQSLQVLREGIKRHPDFYVLRTATAGILAKQGYITEALLHLDRAIEIDSKLHWAYSQKAQLVMQQKQWSDAVNLLNQAIALKDDDEDLYTYQGISLGFLNRWPEAANVLREAISINNRHVPSYINLARAETILKNEQAALEAIEAARQYGATDSMLQTLERQREQIKQMQIQGVQR